MHNIISFEWSRSFVYDRCAYDRKTGLPHVEHEIIVNYTYELFYKELLINARCRDAQRCYTYEVIELIRDGLFHRTIQYGENIYSF